MKLVKKIVPVVLSLTLCASMVAPAFAAVALDKDLHINGDTGELLSHEETNEAGDTVQSYDYYLDQDIELGKTLIIGNNVTASIELNGHKLYLNESVETTFEGNAYGNTHDNQVTVTNGENSVTNEFTGANHAKTTTGDETTIKIGSVIAVGEEGGKAVNTHLTVTDSVGGGQISGGYALGDMGVGWAGGVTVVPGKDISFTMTGGAITGNYSEYDGGGILAFDGTTVNLDGVEVSNNGAGHGGAIRVVRWVNKNPTEISIKDCVFDGNIAAASGGIMQVDDFSNLSTINIEGSEFKNNQSNWVSGIWIMAAESLTVTDSLFHDNHATQGSMIASQNSTAITVKNSIIRDNMSEQEYGGNGGISGGRVTQEGNAICNNTNLNGVLDQAHIPGEWEVTIPAQSGIPGEESRICSVCHAVVETRPIPALPVPTTPEPGSTGSGEAEVEINEVEVPLAGLFTRADAVGYLWQQAGEPEWELSDFEDVPGNHQWAVAIGWAQDMGIAVADLEGNFRPDDLVLRSVEDIELSPEGELQEFLNRYAVYAGIELADGELFIELAGEPDDIIMGEDAQVIFNDFFAKLEAALSAAA